MLNARKYSEMFRLLFTVRFSPVIQREGRAFNTATTSDSLCSSFCFAVAIRNSQNQRNLFPFGFCLDDEFIDREIPVLR